MRPALRAPAIATVLLAGGLTAALAPAATFKPRTRVVSDAAGDAANGAVDLVRVTLGRASNGQLRASLTADRSFRARELRARKGVPGSLCLRLWTKTKHGASPPDYLVCATSNKAGDGMLGTVLQERAGDTPVRVATASVSRSDARNVTLRFSQSSVGRPAAIDFAGETTKAGCLRHACVDSAPDDGGAATFRLEKGAKRPGT